MGCKHKLRKKGVQETTLTVIIGLVIFVLLLVFSQQIVNLLSREQAREVCRLSIVKVELGKAATSGTLQPTLDCPMNVIDIKQGELPSDDSKAKDFVMEKFAVAMRDAWYIAGRGDYVSFQDQFGGGQVGCLISARINFINVDPAKISGVENFLISRSPRESPDSYFSYLTFKNQRAWHIIDASDPTQLKDSDEIDTSKNYYVVYWAAMRDTDLIRVFSPLQHLEDIRVLLGGNERLPQVFVVPEDKFEYINCENLLN